MPEQNRREALVLWRRLRSRSLYRLHQAKESDGQGEITVRRALSALADDPLAQLWFFDDQQAVCRMSVRDVSQLLAGGHRVASETVSYHIFR
jgi:hypothetical protein